MPLGTLDAPAPAFFRQGLSALAKLTLFSVLALFLMVADTRLELAQPLRAVTATLLYPLQWLALRPLLWAQDAGRYFQSLAAAQSSAAVTQQKLVLQSQRANQVEQLTLENSRLRALLGLRERLTTTAKTAQVLYDMADPYTRKVVIDRGSQDDVRTGAPVLDENGVLGQVTRVYPLFSEVTLVTDRDQATPVLNTRTGERGLAFGELTLRAHALELRFMATNADVEVGDLLSTSGVDGVYPAGLPVAKVSKIERRVDSAFAHISCLPLALVAGAGQVLVLDPLATPGPPPAAVAAPPPRAGKKGGK